MRRGRRNVAIMDTPPLPLWRTTRARYDQLVDGTLPTRS